MDAVANTVDWAGCLIGLEFETWGGTPLHLHDRAHPQSRHFHTLEKIKKMLILSNNDPWPKIKMSNANTFKIIWETSELMNWIAVCK